MKKVISIIALVVAMVMAMSVSAFAADPAFMLAEDAVVPEGTTVTPAADSIAVETAATAGNYYGILLVAGDALPTVDNAILYINQATAADVKQAFSVLPIIPTTLVDENDEPVYNLGDPLTLYISSNVAGAELIAIPLVYDAEEEIVVPEYIRADVDNDGEAATLLDAAEIVKYQNFEESVFDNEWYTESVAAILADVDIDGDAGSLLDAAEIVKYQNFEESVFDRPPYTE